jgi:CheY-like chemotaxis protein/chromosome segregation ATPase
MSTKVLVFESDPAFAGELRTELGKLGCSTTVVEDGNVGLQQAGTDKPDLILLSIELPRMNGFSVCNKLKKDAGLKDVPLIIMSSESSDETFEQHKKLRTRAEDYVHKPIAFGELLQHIQSFVALGAEVGGESETAIVIEEDIESSDYLVEEDGAAPAAEEPAKAAVDADVEAFAESAFGRLTEPEAAPPPAPAVPAVSGGRNGATESRAPRKSVSPAGPPARAASLKPVPPPPAHAPAHPPAHAAPPGVDPAEHERVASELAKAKERMVGVESELSDAKREIDKLRMDAGEAEQLTREVEELKTKLAGLASGPKAGAVSSREFLDLREGLNRKDKEILGLKEQLSKKDKEIVETQEKMLALERTKADIDDRLLALERELDDVKEKAAALTTEGERSKKAADDFKARLEKAQAEGEATGKSLAELKTKAAAEVADLEGKLAAARAEFDGTLANDRAEHSRALDEAEARRKADLEQSQRDRETALSAAHERAEEEQRKALDARTARLSKEHADEVEELKSAHERATAAAKEAHEQAIASAKEAHEKAAAAAREGHEQATAAAKEAHDKALEAARTEAADAARAAATREGEDRLAKELAEAKQREESALEALRKEHAEKIAAVENDRDARVATVESKATRELGEANDRLAKLEVDFSGVRGELESLRETKRTDDAASAARIADLEKKLDDTEKQRGELQKSLDEKTEKLQGETGRADRAQSKWEADRQSLDRAKDALAVALAQIEEAEGRAL